nr:unnamed protein product [Digitaria exilis]
MAKDPAMADTAVATIRSLLVRARHCSYPGLVVPTAVHSGPGAASVEFAGVQSRKVQGPPESAMVRNVAAPAQSSLVKELFRASSLKYLPTRLAATARFTAASASESLCHGALLLDAIFSLSLSLLLDTTS